MAKGKISSASLGQSWYNDQYIDERVGSVEAEVGQLKSLGSQTVPGSFADYASVPDNVSGYTVAPTVNDFLYVGADENYDGAMTMYAIADIDSDGEIEYGFVHKVSTDLSNKIDRLDPANEGELPVIDSEGGLVASGKTISGLAQELLEDLTFTPIT